MANTFKNYTTRSIGTAATNVCTASSVTSTVIGMTICNTSTASVKASVALFDGTNTTYVVGSASPGTNGTTIAAGDSMIVFGGDHKLVLNNTNALRVLSSAASSLDCVVSVLEIS